MAADVGAVVVDDVGVDGVDGVAEGDVGVDGRESGDGRDGSTCSSSRSGYRHGRFGQLVWNPDNSDELLRMLREQQCPSWTVLWNRDCLEDENSDCSQIMVWAADDSDDLDAKRTF